MPTLPTHPVSKPYNKQPQKKNYTEAVEKYIKTVEKYICKRKENMNKTAVKNSVKQFIEKIDILENIKSEKRTTHTPTRPSYSTRWLHNDSI